SATARKSDAREAAVDAEATARRQAAYNEGTASATMSWSAWWELFSTGRKFESSDTGRIEADAVRLFLLPQLGDTPLRQIEHADVQGWVDRLCREGRAPSYVRRIVAVFRTSMRAAVLRGVLTASPCADLVLPKVPRRPKRYIEPTAADVLVAQMTQPWADVIALMMETGCRPGEACGLHAHRARDAVLTICDVYVPGKHVIRPWPKDGETRTVPLSARAQEIISRQLEGRPLHEGCGVPHVRDGRCTHQLVFLQDGQPLTPMLIWYHLREAAKKAGVDRTMPYAARRGYATRLARGGLDAFSIAELMGHTDVALTREYVQMTPAAQAQALLALGEPPKLVAVDVRPRETPRETDSDNQGLPGEVKRNQRQAR
ncbi:MAG: tyrosine-type recombinase/integrase, partial [Sciscionella sp.]